MALLYADRFQSGYICALPNGTIDAILAPDAAFPLFERLFVQKMQVARILIDKMGRLQTMKNRVTSGEWQASQVAPAPDV